MDPDWQKGQITRPQALHSHLLPRYPSVLQPSWEVLNQWLPKVHAVAFPNGYLGDKSVIEVIKISKLKKPGISKGRSSPAVSCSMIRGEGRGIDTRMVFTLGVLMLAETVCLLNTCALHIYISLTFKQKYIKNHSRFCLAYKHHQGRP